MNSKTVIFATGTVSKAASPFTMFLLFVWLGISGYSQQSVSNAANAGREFYITYLYNSNINPTLQLKIVVERACYITAKYNNLSNSYWNNWNNTLVQPGIYTANISNNNDVSAGVVVNNGVTSSKTITLTSTEDVCVYAINYNSASTDGTCILPVPSWGTEYRIASGIVPPLSFYATYAVVAKHPNTTVTKHDGSIVTLQQNEVYHCYGTGGTDMTGQKVSANKPIGFYSGATLTEGSSGCSGGYNTADHTYEQLWSTDKWGKEFFIFPIVTPAAYGSWGGRLVIVANENATNVTVSGHINNGTRTYSNMSAGNKQYVCDTMLGLTKIESNKSIMVFLVLPDASIINIPAANQRISHALVAPFILSGTTFINAHGIDLLLPSAYWNQTVIKENGAVVSNATYTVIPSIHFPEWYHIRKNLSNTDVKIDITCPGGFLAFLSGSGTAESYGFTAGSGSYNLQNFFTLKEQATNIYTYHENTNAITHTFDDVDTIFIKRTIESAFTSVTWKINGVNYPLLIDNINMMNSLKFPATALHSGENTVTMSVRYTGAAVDSTYTGKVWKVIQCADSTYIQTLNTVYACYNSSAVLSAMTPTSLVPHPGHKWYSTQNSTVPLHEGDTFHTPLLTVSRSYFVSVYDSTGTVCENSTGNRKEINIIVYSPLTAGTIGSPQSICVTEKALAIKELTATTGGSGSVSHQWQKSSDSISWSNIAGAVNKDFTPPNTLSATTYFRRLDTDVKCGTVHTAGVKITVYAEPVLATEITGAKSVCIGNNITLTNATSGGVWSANNANVFIASPATTPVSVLGMSAGNTFITYTLQNGSCEVKKTFLLKVLPLTTPDLKIGFER